MSIDEACRRGCTSKGGLRALSVFAGLTDAQIAPFVCVPVSNCRNCTNSNVVFGEVPGQPAQLLAHGWYTIETDVTIFWQQVSPAAACNTNPVVTGSKLRAGACTAFFVDASTIDGVLVFSACFQTIPASCCPTPPFVARPEGLIRVIRKDTILPISETGDSATLMAGCPSAAGTCEP